MVAWWRSLVTLTVVGLWVTLVWANDQNGRSHDPTLRELTAELDGLKQLVNARFDSIRLLIDERDKFYAERDRFNHTAMEIALTSVKEQTSSSFASSKEANIKAETQQHDYNTRTNEFRGQLDDQAKRLIPRAEVEAMKVNLEEKIARLEIDVRANREQIGISAGRGEGLDKFWNYLVVVLGLMLSVIGSVWAFTHLKKG